MLKASRLHMSVRPSVQFAFSDAEQYYDCSSLSSFAGPTLDPLPMSITTAVFAASVSVFSTLPSSVQGYLLV